ncbi:velvet factor-domain-containing protein [Pilobolus umbonatus]|nr:velvet factor-domain-containing protein [Pilobolus umbonatus]
MTKSSSHNYTYVPSCFPAKTCSSSQITLINRQQPIHSRVSTNNERDRRPIDPPPIIQIKLNNATPQQINNFHQNAYYFMCANLAHSMDNNEIYTPTHYALSGQTVSSMYKLKDIDNHDGAFFIFGDLSVKIEGTFRLKLSLFEITMTGAVCIDHLFTSPFQVYTTRKFPGMLDSTFLSRAFSDQGARIRLRKENRAQMTSNSRKRKLSILTNSNNLSDLSMVSHRRRGSITSSGTDSCSSEPSPEIGHYSRVLLSPPQQYYDKITSPLSINNITNHLSLPLSPPYHNPPYSTGNHFDLSVKLPPLRTLLDGCKPNSAKEDVAVVAMMQLSQHRNSHKSLHLHED